MKVDSLFPTILEGALRLAARGHYRQFRKRYPQSRPCGPGDEIPSEDCIPYITHPMGVAMILGRIGAGERLLAAALLHDYLEDVPDPEGAEHIREACGEEVLALVRAVSEDKRRDSNAEDTWQLRKEEQIRELTSIEIDAVTLKTADLLHNILSLIRDLEQAVEGTDVWARFNVGMDQQFSYFHGVLEAVSARLGASNTLVCALRKSLVSLEDLGLAQK